MGLIASSALSILGISVWLVMAPRLAQNAPLVTILMRGIRLARLAIRHSLPTVYSVQILLSAPHARTACN